MRIGELSYCVMFFGAWVVGGIALLVFIGMLEGRRTRGAPRARVVNPPVDADVVVAKALPIARLVVVGGVLIAAVAGAYWMHHNRTDVVIIADSGDDARAARYVQFHTPDDMPLAHPHKTDDLFTEGNVWILNQSHHTAKLEDVSYGLNLGFGAEPTLIPPGKMEYTHRIDYVGPNDVPPTEVNVTSGFNFDIRTWLTWDR